MFSATRLRRLQKDYEHVMALQERSNLVYLISTEGNPPERYMIGFRCRGVKEIDADGQPVILDQHWVSLTLTADYPRFRPLMYWGTPIFHPNFDDQGNICIKDWYPQQTIADLCEILVELVQYKNYNTTSPLNMDAAMWAMQHRDELPIDDRSLQVSLKEVLVTGRLPIMTPSAQPTVSPALAAYCEDCGYKFEEQGAGSCPQCGAPRAEL